MTRSGAMTLGVALLAATAFAGAPDDDLAVVKKAVAKAPDTKREDVRPEEPQLEAPKTATAPARKGPPPQWLKVRVVDKGAKKAKVSINLPLSLARALGDEVPFDWRCRHKAPADEGDHRRDRCTLHVSEILTALESGQEIVEIDDDEATVRVWVE